MDADAATNHVTHRVVNCSSGEQSSARYPASLQSTLQCCTMWCDTACFTLQHHVSLQYVHSQLTKHDSTTAQHATAEYDTT